MVAKGNAGVLAPEEAAALQLGHDLLDEVGGDAEVVGDQHDRGPGATAQVVDQVEHLRLHGGIQSGGGLVGDDQVRLPCHVTKFGNIPDGGGRRYLGKQQGDRNKEATAKRTGQRGHDYRPLIGTAFVHTVIDDHSRLAYAEICTDEKASTAIAVLSRAVAWFAEHGVTVEIAL